MCEWILNHYRADNITVPSVSFLSVCFICNNIAFTIGNIMDVVAVLLIHMDKNHVGIIIPNISL